jgi:hypothetical protein
MIIAMPNGDSSWHINSYNGKEKYEDFFVNEFMPAIEKAYFCKTHRVQLNVQGVSVVMAFTFLYIQQKTD